VKVIGYRALDANKLVLVIFTLLLALHFQALTNLALMRRLLHFCVRICVFHGRAVDGLALAVLLYSDVVLWFVNRNSVLVFTPWAMV